MSDITNYIEAKLKKFYGIKKKINLHEPQLKPKDMIYIKKCFNSGLVSTAGKYVNLFEKKIKKITKSKNVISIINGTCGLHISLKVLGIKSNDEVLVPAITFVATANAVAHCNAIPHFVEIEEDTFGIDPIKLEKYLDKNTIIKKGKCFNFNTKRFISAIIPVHVFGHPCKIDKLKALAKKFNLKVIEDATEALGSLYKNKHVGNFGDLGVISFNGNKIVTTGGGGVILCNSNALAKKLRHITSTAKVTHKWRYIHNEVGYNYRLPAINASIALGQLKRFKEMIKNKRKLYYSYKQLYHENNFIKIMKEPKNSKSNYWLQALILDRKYSKFKNKIIDKCNKSGIKARPIWDLLSELKMFKKCPKMNLKISKALFKKTINLPSSSFL